MLRVGLLVSPVKTCYSFFIFQFSVSAQHILRTAQHIPRTDSSPTTTIMSREKALEYKALGNKEFTAKNFEAAIKHFTDAIAEDPTDHVFYSNRYEVDDEYC